MSYNEAGLPFVDPRRSALEQTIEELVERAQLVLATQGRLRELLRANRAIVEQLELEQVLRRIAEAAVALVDARYGALGVIAADGHLEQFIHVGIPDDDALAIGHLPEGHGLLGAVIDSGTPIRLEHIADDSRSTGLPAHHPAMDSFLGVPIRVRNEVFGNLYLTNRGDGPFTQEDEELITALAATAGIAIENARLFDESRRRQRWSAALAGVTAALLSGESDDVLGVVAEGVASAVEADLVCVIVPLAGTGSMIVDTARGSGAAEIQGTIYDRAGTLAGRALDVGGVVTTDDTQAENPGDWQSGSGATVAAGLSAFGRTLGVLTVSRPVEAGRFTDADLEMVADFAAQASVAIELTSARADRAKLDLVEDRSRIARDLHDHVIQRLFASGLALQAAAARAPEPLRAAIDDQVAMIDAAISDIRTAVFALTSRPVAEPTLRHRVLDLVGQLSSGFETTPRLTFTGAVDLLVTAELADDVLAVLREGLSNAEQHADATQTEVAITTDGDTVKVTICDNGRGMAGHAGRSSGITNLKERADRRGGRFAVTPSAGGGTTLTWSVPLEEAVA